MTHLKRKLMMTLALLLTAATSAWAESKPIGLNVEYAVGDVITTTTDVYVFCTNYEYSQAIMLSSSLPATIREIQPTGISFDEFFNLYFISDGSQRENHLADGIEFVSPVGQGDPLPTKVYVASGNGTWQDPYVFAPGPFGTPVPLTRGTGEKINEWTLTNGMPAGNVTVSVDYFAQAEFAKSTDPTPVPLAPAAIANVPANTDAPIVTPGAVANIGTSEVKQGTLMYFVSQSTGKTDPVAPTYDTDGWSDKVPTADGLKQGDVYVWYYIKGAEPATIAERTDANTRSDSDIMPLGTNGIVTLGAEPTYDVSLNKTGIDITDQTLAVLAHRTDITPDVDLVNEDLKGVKKGETVTVSYTGTKRVAGVKAVKKVNVVNLSTLNGNYEAQNGDILTGKLVGNYKVSIADGATVTLAGVTIEGVNSDSYEWAGISCEGDATIVVEDGTSNSVKGFDLKLPGIQVSGDSKLTIKGGSLGTGSLVASSNGAGAGIGGAFNDYCGEIEIQGGNITATGGRGAAGIGGGEDGFWGDIIISGGQVKAIGGNGAAGIGSGYAGDENIYGNISIMGGTVNALGGNGGPGIGSGCGKQSDPNVLTAYCRDITISGGTVMATGGDGAAGIGSGSEKSTCGTITITSTVNSVTATKGSDAPNSIGAGKDSTCGEVTIEDPDKVTQN